MPRVVAVALLLVMLVAAPVLPAALTDPRERVGHHLKEAAGLVRHFEEVLGTSCPKFGSRSEWTRYFETEVDRVVLLFAHFEQAWVEAKRTGDDDLRRSAKKPRQRRDQARALVDKLQTCADENGSGFTPLTVWWRIEREVPKRQAEIALPLPQ